MESWKKIFKKTLPPIIIDLYRFLYKKRSNSIRWIGNYNSWELALELCEGYEKKEILEKCTISLLKVKNGDAIYERDSVIFDKKNYNWPVLTLLQKTALSNDDSLCVLDFGGSLGTSYFQNISFLKGYFNITWCVVEQKNFSDRGKKYFENKELKFFASIDECLKEYTPNIVLLSSVLQYLENPYDIIEKILLLDCKYIIVDRTCVSNIRDDMLTVQIVPKIIYDASYPCWIFSENKLIASFLNYECISKINSEFADPKVINKQNVLWNGYIFKNMEAIQP